MFNIVEGMMIPSCKIEPSLIPYVTAPPLQQQIAMYKGKYIDFFFYIRKLKSSEHN